MFKIFYFKKHHPLSKKITNTIFWFLILLSLYFFLADVRIQLLSDHPYFMGTFALLSAFALFLPHFIYFKTNLKNKYHENVVFFFEGAAALMLAINWLGGLGAFRWRIGYDSFTHFTTSLIGAFLAYLAALIVFQKSIPYGRGFLFIIIPFLLTLFWGITNEVLEYGFDVAFGTATFGEIGDPFDTGKDLIYDFWGAGLGVLLGARWGRKMLEKWRVNQPLPR